MFRLHTNKHVLRYALGGRNTSEEYVRELLGSLGIEVYSWHIVSDIEGSYCRVMIPKGDRTKAQLAFKARGIHVLP